MTNYDEKSNGSSKSNSNERKNKNKRMKKNDTAEVTKVVFESNRKKSISVAKSRAKKSDKYVFDNSQIDDSEEEIIDTTQKSRTQ